MKINEVIVEGTKKIRKAAELATPNLETWPALDNNNSPYLAYRFGVALARSPAPIEHTEGPIGGQFTTIGYSEADEEILKAAAKAMGVSPVVQTTKGSKELPWINTVSPMTPKGPVKRKSK